MSFGIKLAFKIEMIKNVIFITTSLRSIPFSLAAILRRNVFEHLIGKMDLVRRQRRW